MLYRRCKEQMKGIQRFFSFSCSGISKGFLPLWPGKHSIQAPPPPSPRPPPGNYPLWCKHLIHKGICKLQPREAASPPFSSGRGGRVNRSKPGRHGKHRESCWEQSTTSSSTAPANQYRGTQRKSYQKRKLRLFLINALRNSPASLYSNIWTWGEETYTVYYIGSLRFLLGFQCKSPSQSHGTDCSADTAPLHGIIFPRNGL